MLVDSHCHLDYHQRDGDLDAVIGRAHDAGVGTMVTICTEIAAFDTVHAIAQAHGGIWCTVGTHPHEAAKDVAVPLDTLVALAKSPAVVGIGETGLDYHYDHSPREDQRTSFRKHIEAARRSSLPLVIHSRDADDEMASILEEEMKSSPFQGVMHCFSSGLELAEKAVELGLYISISGIVTFKKAEELREIVRKVPLERLLVETDSPYLAPEPNRGRRNEPAMVVHPAQRVAALKGLTAEKLAATTTENFFRLFARAEAPGD